MQSPEQSSATTDVCHQERNISDGRIEGLRVKWWEWEWEFIYSDLALADPTNTQLQCTLAPQTSILIQHQRFIA